MSLSRDSASLYDPIRPEEVTDAGEEKNAVGFLCIKRQVEKKSTTLIYIFILNLSMRDESHGWQSNENFTISKFLGAIY